MGNQVTNLVHQAIDSAVADACRWDSPYFAHGRLRQVLGEDLFDKIDRIVPEHLALLAGDLHVTEDRSTIKERVFELATTEVDRTLNARITARSGWKPLHPQAPGARTPATPTPAPEGDRSLS